MSGDIGVFLGRGVAAAALTKPGAAGPAPFEGTWDAERPAELVVRLREHFGSVDRIALAVGLGLLDVRPLELPDVGAVERRRMVLLEPEKYFPVLEHGRYVAGIIGNPPLAFLLEAEPLDRWIAVFELWAPVLRVDAAPVAAARVSPDRGKITIPDGPAVALLEVENGKPIRLTRGALPDSAPRCAPADIARGAALGIDDSLDDALMPDSLADNVMLGRRRRLAVAAVAAALAFVLTLWAVNLSRRNLLVRIDGAIAAEASRAAPVLPDSVTISARERMAVAQILRNRPDRLEVLAELSSLLPANVVLQGVESEGTHWRIEGTAPSAADVVRLLAGRAQFDSVRSLRAPAPEVIAGRSVERFALSFYVRP